jgi:hypothetical protein
MLTTAWASVRGIEEDIYCPLAYIEYKLHCCWLVNAAAMTELKCGHMFDALVEFKTSDVQKHTLVGTVNVHVQSIYIII